MAEKLAYYGFRYMFASLESLKKDVDFESIKLSERLALLTFAAFTYESFLNHAGHHVLRSWDAHLKPKLSPQGKMEFLCELGKIDIDYSCSPFQSFKKVMELRNQLAHAETEYVSYDPVNHADPKDWPKPKWQRVVSSLDLSRVIADLEEIVAIIEKGFGLPPVPSFLLMERVDVPESV